MNRGLKHLCILFTCLSVVLLSSILVFADENDEEAIGNIVLLWWLYLYQRVTEREGE